MSITIDGDNITVQLETTNVNVSVGGAPVVGEGGGVTDHGALTGLSDDDHTQYHTDARGDARYALLSHTHAQSDVTGLVSDLAGKASSSHTHAQSDITNLVTDLSYKDIYSDFLRTFGSTTKGESLVRSFQISAGSVLIDGVIRWVPIKIFESGTITGFSFWQHVVGSYTPDNENAAKLFTQSGGTLTEVATTGNVAALWSTGSSNSLRDVNFTSTYAATAGWHWLAIIYNNSAQTTAPQIGVAAGMTNAGVSAIGLTSNRISGQSTATSIPSSQALSGLSNGANNNWLRVF